MTDSAQFNCIHKARNGGLADIIFVHGLTGDAHKTWTHDEQGQSGFWPAWYAEDMPAVSIYTLGYPASLFKKWANKEMDIFERAGNTLEILANHGIGNRPIIFITHSLGGILTKIILRRSGEVTEKAWHDITDNTRMVVFLGTPHSGAVLAKVADILPATSTHIKLLANEIGFLEDLNCAFRNFADSNPKLTTLVYYEKHATKAGVLVVDRTSADPGVTRANLVAVDKDHLNISKPHSKDDTIYMGVARRIQEILRDTATGDRAPEDDYSQKPERDRRDLLQKLIDAGREAEYPFANDRQNEFARRYQSTGLMTAAKEDHDSLLSEIETRFALHVYHPLICKGESDAKISAAIQAHIIDPLTARRIGETAFTAKNILSGLYFLTEQCHVKWDAVK